MPLCLTIVVVFCFAKGTLWALFLPDNTPKSVKRGLISPGASVAANRGAVLVFAARQGLAAALCAASP